VIMSGKITFHFDDGFMSHYTMAFPIFREFGAVGALSLIADPARGMGYEKALEMQEEGWEILCHSRRHIFMNSPLPEETVREEIVESKRLLEEAGFTISCFITPMSVCHVSMRPALAAHYEAAFTVYTNSADQPIERLINARPVNRYALHRACLAAKTLDELKAYVDYVAREDAWLVFYDHDIGSGANITPERLRALLAYCREKGVEIVTTRDALRTELCRTRILEEGWDGQNCYVHIRAAADGEGKVLLTGQLMDVRGSDCFELLRANFSSDNGKTWSGFRPQEVFASVYTDTERSVSCDMTPFYHKKTGRFLATGHTAQYKLGSLFPMEAEGYHRVTPYAVYNEKTGQFGPVKSILMPDPVKFRDCGSGCSQIWECENGDLLIPLSFRETKDGVVQDAKSTVIRASFDGETIRCLEIGNDLEVPDEVRGIGECSLVCFGGRYYLTVRGDSYGYVCRSDDGIHFTQPEIWRYSDGETVPTYNTQSHWMVCREKLYLVYTRKNGHNDHVFRHRAPLYAAEVDVGSLTLKQETEFVAVPERGARLGNFGVTSDGKDALIVVSEWMQPAGCEAYGSDNAIWYTDVTLGE